MLFRFDTDEIVQSFECEDGTCEVVIPDELYERYLSAFNALQQAWDEIEEHYKAQNPDLWPEPEPPAPAPTLTITDPLPRPRTLDEYQRDQEAAR